MKTNTKIYSLFFNRWAVLVWLATIVIGIIAVPAMVTFAQQPSPPPRRVPFVLGASGNSVGGTYGPESRQPGCPGILASPTDKTWQIWPSNGVIELGNGVRSVILQIWQCSGYGSRSEAQGIYFSIRPPGGDWFSIQSKITPLSSSINDDGTDASIYAADAFYEFSPNSQPGTYTLAVGNSILGWRTYSLEVRTEPVVSLQDPVTDWPKTLFYEGETAEINYWWFAPGSHLEIGLYFLDNEQNPLIDLWEITVDENGNYRGEVFFPDGVQSGTYQLAVCNLNEDFCSRPVLSEPFSAFSEANASVAGSSGNQYESLPVQTK
jgi:hypothetical protein